MLLHLQERQYTEYMKRRITRQSLDELQRALTTLSYREQEYYIGGGTGTEADPYTFIEYQEALNSNSWLGGYVGMPETSEVEDEETGEITKKEIIKTIYIAKSKQPNKEDDGIVLDDVIVTGVYKSKDQKNSGSSGGNESDFYFGYFTRGIGSGIWDESWHDISGNVSGLWLDSSLSGFYMNGGSGIWSPDVYTDADSGGGGGRRRALPYNPIDPDLPRFKSITYQIKEKGAETLKSYINDLYGGSNLFKAFTQKFEKSHGFAKATIILSDRITGNNYGSTRHNKDLVGADGKLPITIEIQRYFVNSAHKVLVMATILHEMVHADWLRLSYGAEGGKISPFGTEQATPTIREYHKRYPHKDPNKIHHELIADFYKGDIISALKEIFPNGKSLGVPQAQYEDALEAAFWIGLDETESWLALPQKKRAYIKELQTFFNPNKSSNR